MADHADARVGDEGTTSEELATRSGVVSEGPLRSQAASAHAAEPAVGEELDALIGKTIGDRFRILRPIARGGMGRVYFAAQLALDRPCAVKVLDPVFQSKSTDDFQRRFFLEASIVAKLKHPNNVKLYDYGKTADRVFYIAMEYLEGRTLGKAIRADAPMEPQRAMHIARQLCRALREAHGLGVVHRDLKPANVFLISHDDDPDFVKVLDFGLVKDIHTTKEQFTASGCFIGSPRYMAPEQVECVHVDERADVYAIGVILYEMLTGRVPFERETDFAVLMAQLKDPVPPLGVRVSRALEQAVFRCLEKNPERRFESADALLKALRSAARAASSAGVRLSLTVEADAKVGDGGEGDGPLGTTPSTLTPALATGTPSQRVALASARESAPSAMAPNVGRAPRSPSSRMQLVAIFAAAVAVIGLTVAFALRDARTKNGPSRASASAPLSAGAPAIIAPSSAPVTTASAATVLTLRVHIASNPAGARVREDGIEVCTATPCEVVYQGPEAAAERTHGYLVAKEGFEPAHGKALAANPTVDVTLRPSAPGGAALPHRGTGAPQPSGGYRGFPE